MRFFTTTSFLLIALTFGAPVAFADGPCARGQSIIKMGGIDFDATRCQIALDAEYMGKMQSKINELSAVIALERSDAAKASEDAVAKAKYWSEWVAAEKLAGHASPENQNTPAGDGVK